jgi:hypothetical protein
MSLFNSIFINLSYCSAINIYDPGLAVSLAILPPNQLKPESTDNAEITSMTQLVGIYLVRVHISLEDRTLFVKFKINGFLTPQIALSNIFNELISEYNVLKPQFLPFQV